jgi:plasmid maintenance system antidote protein VapI
LDFGNWSIWVNGNWRVTFRFAGADGISPHLAIRPELAGSSTARFWMCLQANCDLAQALKHDQPPVKALQDKVA